MGIDDSKTWCAASQLYLLARTEVIVVLGSIIGATDEELTFGV